MNRSLRRVWIGLFLSAAVSDAREPSVHPDAHNLRDRGSTVVVRRDTAARGRSALDQLAARLRSLVLMDSIGTLDGPAATVIGHIRDVDVAPDGRLFVLDDAFQRVRVFDRSGAPAFTIGGEGSGPLDFRTVWSGWVENDTTFAVPDGVLGAKYLTVTTSVRAALQRVTPLETSATGGSGVRGRSYT
mgnify:CR=1 FL=1